MFVNTNPLETIETIKVRGNRFLPFSRFRKASDGTMGRCKALRAGLEDGEEEGEEEERLCIDGRLAFLLKGEGVAFRSNATVRW